MGFQLFYTSAPRLLQAGRSGFGTVACHQEIPAWLVGEIERASQFSRVSGMDSARVVIRHMVFGKGDRTHHVLSRIQDAGADYTGRTNHAAHHFIFSAAEAAQATSLGITPADVLAYLESNGLWRTAWAGEPGHFTAEDILSIKSIPKAITLPASTYWGALVPNHPEFASILAPGKTAEACWIVYPDGWRDAIVYAMGESLALHPNPWAISFSNDLQPTDNEQEIAWRAISIHSPLLEKAIASVRPCIDLTKPNEIQVAPEPDFIELARTGRKPLPKRQAAPRVQPDTVTPAPEPKATPQNLTRLSRPLSVESTPAKRKNPYALPLTIGLALIALALLTWAGIWGYGEYSRKIEIQNQTVKLQQEYPDLSNVKLPTFQSAEELENLRSFLHSTSGEPSPEKTSAADDALNKMRGIEPADWNELRTFCNKRLDSVKEKQKETANKERLDELYGKLLENDISSDQFNELSTLIKSLHPDDNKWNNVIEVSKWVQQNKTEPGDNKLWMQKPELPQHPKLQNFIAGIYASIGKAKVEAFNQLAEQDKSWEAFNNELINLLSDWPKDSNPPQYEFLKDKVVDKKPDPNSPLDFDGLGLKQPTAYNSDKKSNSEVELPQAPTTAVPLFITDQKSFQNYKPTENPKQKWKPLKPDSPISWPIESPINWGKDSSASQFENISEGINGFLVISNDDPPKSIHYVISKDFFKNIIPLNINSEEIYEFKENSILIKNEFRDFIDSIYSDKDSKYAIDLKLNFKIPFAEMKPSFSNFQSDKIDLKNELQEKISFRNKEIEALNTEIPGLDIGRKELETPFEKEFPWDSEGKIRKDFNNRDIWAEFRKSVKDDIKDIDKEKRNNLEHTLNHDRFKDNVDKFITIYDNKEELEKFNKALSSVDKKIQSWFFYDAEHNKLKDNFKESFKKQFDKKYFDSEKKKIDEIVSKLDGKKKTKTLKENEIKELNSTTSPATATLEISINEDSFQQPLIKTEVKIPFDLPPSNSPAKP